MKLRPGDRLRCSNPVCRLQVIVTDMGSGKETETSLRCACGSTMKKFYEKTAVNKIRLTRDVSTVAGARGTRP